MEVIDKRAHDNKSSFASTDNVMMKQIWDTHSDQPHFVDVKPFLYIVEDILNRSAPTIHRVIHGTAEYTDTNHTVDERIDSVDFDNTFEALSHVIHKLSCELYCKCSGGDAHASTVLLCKTIPSYTWEAKVVLVLAAFAVNYGDFWLVAQICTTNPLAKSIALLKQVADIIEHSKAIEPHFDAIDKLIKAIMNVTKRIVEFSELPLDYLSPDKPPISVAMAHIPAASYWTIRSIVACASQFATITGMRHEYTGTTSDLWEISSMTHKLNNIHDHLTNELARCRQYIEEMRYDEEYRNLIRLLESSHQDNMKVIRAIFSTDDTPVLVIGNDKEKKPVSIELLRRKDVLLLISDLDLPLEEIEVLENVYEMRHDIQYEMVWIPIVDRLTGWSEQHQYKFAELQLKMPWYTVTSPLVIKGSVTRYIKEFWNFDKKTIIVALDKVGKVSSKNALHMVWIWGNLAFPFTDEKEEALWRAERWRLELLVNGIDQEILDWIKQNKLICLYGGEDIQWIRDFTTTAKAVATDLNVSLELVYVGKNNTPKKRLEGITSIIKREKLSLYWPDHTSTWFFWSRLESMRFSKARHGMTPENDQIMKEVQTILSYDNSEQGWVILWKGSTEKARANGQLALLTLKDFSAWKQQAVDLGLVPALDSELKKRHTPQHCISLILPGIGLDIPQKMTCAECGLEMERYFMFRCCND